MEERIAAGAFGGIVGGIVSGLLLQHHWLVSPTGLFYGDYAVTSNWSNHLALCLIFGMIFGALCGGRFTKLPGRLLAGGVAGLLLWIAGQWWHLGPLPPGVWGFLGYLVLGATTGLGFHLTVNRRSY
ncbi:MAG: hypothetical protein GX058_01655 [Firmicutes bacterium]|nr:hypothetical protein [Bacillota bacterium]